LLNIGVFIEDKGSFEVNSLASLDGISIKKRFFFKFASDVREYERSSVPSDDFSKLLKEKADIYTFIERCWCGPIVNPSKKWRKFSDNIALATISTYEEWVMQVGKKTRNMIRKSEKTGVRTQTLEPDEKLAEGIWKIYNETPIRQERAFPHYGETLEHVRNMVFCPVDCVYIVAYLESEIVGFIHLVFGDQIGVVSQILSLQEHKDKAVNNSLLAKAIEICAQRKIQHVMYGRIGNHPSLDKFKESNGFVKYPLTRYFLALTVKGRLAVTLGLQRELKDRLPQWFKLRLLPVYNWVSKSKSGF
jgi:hypothetical protein